MQLGYRKPLVMDDLWYIYIKDFYKRCLLRSFYCLFVRNLKKDDQCAVITEQFQKHWQIELKKEK
jgi:hypothetical protein